jgi:hypothetical protein
MLFMQIKKKKAINSSLHLAVVLLLLIATQVTAQTRPTTVSDLKKTFLSPPEAASPWVFWYWMNAAVSAEGITADLEAMKQAGIGGAYLMPIKGATNPSLYSPAVEQLTPLWWKMVKHALKEADRLGLKIGMHVSDGFALAGGPWITPELSMQKVVWKKHRISGGQQFNDTLGVPDSNEAFYRDIAVFAYPEPAGGEHSTKALIPKVTTSKAGGDADAQLLAVPGNKKSFSCEDKCWIQYSFDQPFTCRTIVIKARTNYQSNRLLVEVSDDGKTFRSLGRLEPPRHGWQDWDSDYTHVIPATTARYFRFVYDKEGSEPGAEDLDAAKWKPALKIMGIELSGEPRIHQYEGKNGEVWRVSKRTSPQQVPDSVCVPLKGLIDLSGKLDKNGRLRWDVPPGEWIILRMGHTSTGHRNETGGGGKGLECDKFNPEAIRKQFDGWFGEAVRQAGPELAAEVLKLFHVDSWECGSQNWSPVFRNEFKKRRGYDLLPYLPVMAGIPLESAAFSEKVLHDVRQTIAELVNDVFYVTLKNLAHAKGATFTAESVAPTMVSDGMLHYQSVDVPMGEFWLRSPTHDKPNDMMDAISGAHIYGKNIIQAEGFTELRMHWDEHPGLLKTLGDRNYALGINRMAYHVFIHNPWMNRKPGMTLDDIGLYFQRDQTWWKHGGRAWVDYARRCQALLQVGKPVVDVAVFTGEETPRRSVLPERLVSVLPGIMGEEIVRREAKRLANEGQPVRQMPRGVSHAANMSDPEDWLDPLQGYKYDSYNKDALLRLSTVKNGRIELPGGASYAVLILPGTHQMAPDGRLMSPEVAIKLKELVNKGATIVLNEKPELARGIQPLMATKGKEAVESLWSEGKVTRSGQLSAIKVALPGKGRIIKGPFTATSFSSLGIEKDVVVLEGKERAEGIAWTHRTAPGLDIYFISNQQNRERTIEVSLRVQGRIPELWDAVTGETTYARTWHFAGGRTVLPIRLHENGSLFIVLQQPTKKSGATLGNNWTDSRPVHTIEGAWTVQFDTAYGGPAEPLVFPALQDWSLHADDRIRYYSGTAVYSKEIEWNPVTKTNRVWLHLGKIANVAHVKVNGISCGTVWTAPYKIDITKALKKGKNQLQIELTNTWANRLIGDLRSAESLRRTQTTAPLRPFRTKEENTLLEAGLLGPIVIEISK